jgi:hypothetical protein
MRRFLAWLGCAAGAAWILKKLRRLPEPAAAADPADALRRKLDETRAVTEPGPEPGPQPPAAGLDERRREVHGRGRAAIDAMRSRGDDRE